jgi:hypothetical protein
MVIAGVAGEHVHLVLETFLFLEDLKTGIGALGAGARSSGL